MNNSDLTRRPGDVTGYIKPIIWDLMDLAAFDKSSNEEITEWQQPMAANTKVSTRNCHRLRFLTSALQKDCLVVSTYPSEKYELVSWDDDIPNIWKNKKCSKPPTRRMLDKHWNGKDWRLLWAVFASRRKSPMPSTCGKTCVQEQEWSHHRFPDEFLYWMYFIW